MRCCVPCEQHNRSGLGRQFLRFVTFRGNLNTTPRTKAKMPPASRLVVSIPLILTPLTAHGDSLSGAGTSVRGVRAPSSPILNGGRETRRSPR